MDSCTKKVWHSDCTKFNFTLDPAEAAYYDPQTT